MLLIELPTFMNQILKYDMSSVSIKLVAMRDLTDHKLTRSCPSECRTVVRAVLVYVVFHHGSQQGVNRHAGQGSDYSNGV